MLNPKLKLNSKIFNADVEQIPTRKGFGLGLLSAGEQDKNIVGLCADLTESTQMNLFADRFPERFIQTGIAEQNLVTTASGLSAMGKIPFCSSYAIFSPGRNWEQIRTTIAYNDRKVVIVGSHAGVSVGADGGSHQALEDIALMRVMPNMDVFSPCDSIEAEKATLALSKTKVLNLASVKPVDKDAILNLAKETKALVTVEEHQVSGGMGSLISEIVAENFPVPIEFIGVHDKFGQSGTPEELFKYYGLDKDSIKSAVKKVLRRKSS